MKKLNKKKRRQREQTNTEFKAKGSKHFTQTGLKKKSLCFVETRISLVSKQKSVTELHL